MQRYKQQMSDGHDSNLQKATERRENGTGIVKKQYSTYNFYMKEKLNERLKQAKQTDAKVNMSEIFKSIADDWKNQEDMDKWYEEHQNDEQR